MQQATTQRLDAVIQAHCLAVLQAHQGKVGAAAKALGIGRATLYRYLARWEGCTTCAEAPEDAKRGECSKSRRSCGHHCDCSWTQDACCWCGASLHEEQQP